MIWNYATHLLNPIQPWGPRYIDARCGRRVHAEKEKMVTTTNPDEVTCTKCKGYIENPVRILRKYGTVKVFKDPRGLMLLAANGYKIDLILYLRFSTSQNSYVIYGETRSGNAFEKFFDTTSFKDAMNQLVNYYETELIPLSK